MMLLLVLTVIALAQTAAFRAPVGATWGVQRASRRAQLQPTLRRSPWTSAKTCMAKKDDKEVDNLEGEEPSAFDQVASKGLAGVLAIAAAEAIFWALGVPLASLYVKYTTGEWIDLTSQEGQLQAAGFSFGYGGFATLILQYRVTLFAIPLVPLMEDLVVKPGKKFFGEKFGEKS
jgi:hypothetical protein